MKLSKFLRQSLMVFIIKCFRTIVFIFIVISTTFWPMCPPAFFKYLSNSGTYTELRTTSFIESMEVAFSDSVSHNRFFFFYLCSYSYFFSSNLFNYRFPYCIHMYTWSTKQVIVAQHICWYLKTSNPSMFCSINYFNFIPSGQMVSLFLPYMVCHTRLFNLTSYYRLPMFF